MDLSSRTISTKAMDIKLDLSYIIWHPITLYAFVSNTEPVPTILPWLEWTGVYAALYSHIMSLTDHCVLTDPSTGLSLKDIEHFQQPFHALKVLISANGFIVYICFNTDLVHTILD